MTLPAVIIAQKKNLNFIQTSGKRGLSPHHIVFFLLVDDKSSLLFDLVINIWL